MYWRFIKPLPVFPPEEKYSLVDQIRRCSYSIPANIVEGHSKSTSRDFLRYLYISRGSIEELKYFLLLSRDLNYINHEKYEKLLNMTNETSYLLNQFIRSIKPQQP